MNLLPDIKGPLLMSFKLPEGKKNSALTLEISVNSQYTSTLKITQTNSSIIPFKDIQLEVLIYHDFKMVEVKKDLIDQIPKMDQKDKCIRLLITWT